MDDKPQTPLTPAFGELMSNRRWTHRRLQHHLRKLLKDPRILIYLEPIPTFKLADAHTQWSTGKSIVVTIDTARVELVRGAIHELLHVLLDDTMWPFSSEVEESFISALEADIHATMEEEGWTSEFAALLQARIDATPPRVRPNPKAGLFHPSQEESPVETLPKAAKVKARPIS